MTSSRAPERPAVRLATPAELADAAPGHAAFVGRPVDPAEFDPTLPQHHAAWAAFSARTVRLPRGGHEGEWLLLELGLKPVLRQALPATRLPAFAARCARRGLVFARGSSVGVGREAQDGDLVYVARDLAQAEAARDTEAALLAAQRGGDDGEGGGASGAIASDITSTPAPTRRLRDAHAARALGALLGFPPCCVDAFVQVARDGRDEKAGMLDHALAASRAFHPRLNNLSLGAFHYIGWSPCRFDCPASLALADQSADALQKRDEAAWLVVDRLLARPRFWSDERRQLIVSGRWDGRALRFKSVRTPWALDADDRHRASEWLYFADAAGELIGGGALVPGQEGWTLHRAGREPSAWAPPKEARWLPWGWGT